MEFISRYNSWNLIIVFGDMCIVANRSEKIVMEKSKMKVAHGS